LLYRSGAMDVYQQQFTSSSSPFSSPYFFLSAKIDPASNKMTFNYTTNAGVLKLSSITDADGRGTLLSYNASSSNLISSVTDPFGRSISLSYYSSSMISNVVDVVGLTNTFTYDSSNTVQTLTTPYGTTTFSLASGRTDSNGDTGNGILVIQPDNSRQFFFYSDTVSSLPDSYMVPNTLSLSNTFETNGLNGLVTFYWNANQYSDLASSFQTMTSAASVISALSSNDFLKARLRHWLRFSDNSLSKILSVERGASSDGVTTGQVTWYDYTGKPALNQVGTQSLPLFIAQVLPDGTTHFDQFTRNSLGKPTAVVSSWTQANGTVGTRTSSLTYSSDGFDLIKWIDPLNHQVSSNLYNSLHLVATNWNANTEMTTYQYDSAGRVANVLAPTGLTTQYQYYTTTGTNLDNLGYVQQIVDVGLRTNSFGYSKGLVSARTNELNLALTLSWDSLQRMVNVSYPDSSSVSNLYTKLDLTGTKDRLGNWTYYAYDALRRRTAETNALTNVTRYTYCVCGSLYSIQDALGNMTYFYYDNLGRMTNVNYPGGSLTKVYDAMSQLVQVYDYDHPTLGTNTFSYNNQGLLSVSTKGSLQASALTYDVLDRPTNVVDANGIAVGYTYDSLSRMLTRSYPDNGVEKFGYTANIAGVTAYTNQPGTIVKLYSYDLLGRKIKEIGQGVSTNQFTYDPAGDVRTLTDGKNQATTWNYDQYGRLTNKLDAVREAVRFGYDADSRITSRWTAAKGDTTTYSYDPVSNLTQSTAPSGTNTFSYDPR
jgi:YD repeat-containing protein